MKVDKYINGNYGILDKSGNYGIVPPLYFGQMVYKNKKGKYALHENVPDNYFKKSSCLHKNGWYRYYHYDLWLPKGKNWDDRRVLNTDAVLEQYYPKINIK